MSQKAIWAILTMMTLIALLLASCGPRAAPAPAIQTPAVPTPAAPTPTPAPAQGTPAPTPVALAEKPKYGGTFNVVTPTDVTVWDTGIARSSETLGSCCNHNQLMELMWEKGLAGTGEFDYGQGATFENYGQGLAESWKIPDQYTWIFQIRRGVRYQMPGTDAYVREAHRLAGGRELTVDDIIYNFTRLMKTNVKTSGIGIFQPGLSNAATFEKTGPWELTLKFPVDPFTSWFWVVQANWGFHAPEVLKKYGDVLDWRNRVGTGPFIVIDYVSGSAATMVRSANYWKRNPVGPGKNDQLPYIDTVKYLIVPDLSTRLAVMRTGNGDWIEEIQGEDARSLLKTTPRLQSLKYLGRPLVAHGRVDKPDQPWANKKVRQALTMATDFLALKNDLYGGEAVMLNWPLAPNQPPYVPLEKQPENIQALYKYNPEKARQLLAEAGYPKGFKARMLVQATTTMLDPAAALKAMWEKAGVEIELQPRERAVFTAIAQARSFDEMLFAENSSSGFGPYPSMTNIRGPSQNNRVYLNDPPGTDPYSESLFQEMQKHVIVNFPEVERLYREKMLPYVLENAFYIQIPSPYVYRLWQPWVKNYFGESWGDAAQYLWIDRDLKEKVTGRR